MPVHRRARRVGHRARAPRRPRAGRDGAALPARARGRGSRRTPRRAGRPRRLRRLLPARPAEGLLMRIFDPHIHMTSRTTDDYEAMYASGVRALVEPAFWLGQPRTTVGSFTDYFDALVGWERFRASQFGIAPPLHDRAQPQGGQRPAVRRGARRAPALPRQGRRGRRGRGRLRLDDRRGGEGVRAAAGARRGVRAAGDGPHAPPRQGAGHPPHPRARHRVGPRARHGRRRPPQRGDRRPGRRGRLLDGLLDLPRHQDGRAPDGRDPAAPRPRPGAGQLGRRLGPQRPAQDLEDRCGDARGRLLRRRRRPRAVAQPDRVLRPERPAARRPGPRRRRLRRRRRLGDLRGQLDPARLAGLTMRLQHPDGTVVHLGYGTNVLPAEDVDGLIAQVGTYGDRLRQHLGTDRVGLGMWLPAAAARRLASDLDAVARLRDAIDEHGVEIVTLNASPTPPSRTRSSRSASTTRPGRSAPVSTTPSTWPACWPR